MVVAPGTKRIKLKSANFGPIAEADIELRPLSVFVGPSNTGKSYLAILVYALHQFFGDFGQTGSNRGMRGGLFSRRLSLLAPLVQMALSATDIDHLYEWAASERVRIETASRAGTMPSDWGLSSDVYGVVRRALAEVRSLSDVLKEEIVRCFGFELPTNMIRYSLNDSQVYEMHTLVSNELVDGGTYRYEIGMNKERASIEPAIPDTVSFSTLGNFSFPWFFLSSNDADDKRDSNARIQLAILTSAALSASVGPLGRPAHYLPADRAGVMHSHQVAVRGLIAGASRTVLRRASVMPVLSGVLGDFLEQLVELGAAPASDEFEGGDTLSQLLEAGLMNGSVGVERSEIDYPSFVYRPNDWGRNLPLMHSSSMVSELAPVVLYLRHVVRPGDTLIIEEPESHLHPTAQVEFTRILAAAVKAGIRIIITTHSEWVLWELANLVRMSDLPLESRKRIDGAEQAIGAADVGAWLFQPDAEKGGSVVNEIPLDMESGTFPAGYSLTAESLYRRWSTINRRIGKL